MTEISAQDFLFAPDSPDRYRWPDNPVRPNWITYMTYLQVNNKDEVNRIGRKLAEHYEKGFNVLASYRNFLKAGGQQALSQGEKLYICNTFFAIAKHEGIIVTGDEMNMIVHRNRLEPYKGEIAKGMIKVASNDIIKKGLIDTFNVAIQIAMEHLSRK